ncbi:MAG: DUF47 domain-containing protein [Halothiobacillaceae bacterium]
MPSRWIKTLVDRVLPREADFYTMLAEQARMLHLTLTNLHEFMRTADAELHEVLKRDEHEADHIKVRNLRTLNESFSTPFDREDIHAAIEAMDWVITHAKSTANEMYAFKIAPDSAMRAICRELETGGAALEEGFGALSTRPDESVHQADIARHAQRRVEKLYRMALADRFEAGDPMEALKYREIYHHLMDGSRRLHAAANILHDIVVKIS